MTQPEKIEHILNGGCEYFGFKRDDLIKEHDKGDKVWRPKTYLVIFLHKFTILNNTEISKLLGYKHGTAVSYHLKRMKEELSEDMYGCAKTKMIYNELLKYLKL